MNQRRLILYISTSLDGYIAKPGDDLSFLERVHQEGEDYGYQEFVDSVDTVIMGRRTYDWVMRQVDEFPHADKETYIVTRDPKPGQGKVNFYAGDVKELVKSLKQKIGKNIFCDGGAGVVDTLLKERLIDEMIISVVPVLVGNGIRLFREGQPEQDLELVEMKQFKTGLVQMHYRKV